MSYLFIDESWRGNPVVFRPASLIVAHLALLKASGVMIHGLTSGLGWQPANCVGANADASWAFGRLVDAFIVVVFMFLFWRLQRDCHCECYGLRHARRRTQ